MVRPKSRRTGGGSASGNRRPSKSKASASPMPTDTYWPGTIASPSPADLETSADTATSITDEEDYDEEEECGFSSSIFDSILIIHCTHREPDYQIPWQNIHQSTSTSSGFVIDVKGIGKRIMTNAHSVEYGSIVQVQRRGDSQKFVAKVVAIGQECDLALLDVPDAEFWDGFSEEAAKGLEFGSLPQLQDDVEVVGYPTGGDSLSVTSGVVSRIEMQEYTQAGFHLLAMQIDAAINAGNSGGPVVDMDGNVVGVAFQSLTCAENIGYVVPVPVVQHFLEDIRRNNKFTGFASFGMRLSILENQALRKSLGMQSQHSGVLVRKMAPLSLAKDAIQANDVIMELDGIQVANDGKVPFRPGERVSLVCYLQTKFVGDNVKVKLFRSGKEIEALAPVSIQKDLVPSHWNSEPPPYFMVGGLVFTALSVPYLTAGDAYEEYVSDDISYLLGMVGKYMEQDDEEVVILCQVLAHKCNLGYEHISDLKIENFNDVKIRSLQQLQSLIEHSEEEFLKFEFAPAGRIVVLEREGLDDATKAVCEEHSIREPFRSRK